jgi:hypothetical protein
LPIRNEEQAEMPNVAFPLIFMDFFRFTAILPAVATMENRSGDRHPEGIGNQKGRGEIKKWQSWQSRAYA